MLYKIHLTRNEDSTYNLIVNLSIEKEEFAMDFFGRKRLYESGNPLGFIRQYGKNRVIKSVKLFIAGALIASLTWADFSNVMAATERYNMSYLYTGTASAQIGYVKNAKQSLNTVTPNFFTVNKNGELVVENISKDFVAAIHALGIKVVPFISNHWDREAGISFLKNIKKHSTEIANVIKEYNLDGINVDIENVTPNEKDAYTEFVSELRNKIPNVKEVSVAVAANPREFKTGWHGSYDYEQLAKYADHLFIMAYDEHYQGSEPGPVASLSFVENSIKYALKYVPKEKIVLGIPFYGRVWDNTGVFKGNGVDLSQVDTFISTYKGNVVFDQTARSPKVEFTIKEGDKMMSIYGVKMTPGKYVIWFENEKSFEEKLELVSKYDIKGAGSWALGKEKGSIWDHYSVWLNGEGSSSDNKNSIAEQNNNLQNQSANSSKTSEKVTAAQKLPAYRTVNKAGKVTAALLFVRTSASTGSKKTATLKKGDICKVIESGTNGWSKVELKNNKTGYVSSSYLRILKIKQVKKKADIRSRASLKSKIIGKLKKGNKVTVISKKGRFTKIWYKSKVRYVETRFIT